MKRRILLFMMTALLSVGAWAADDVTLSTDFIVLDWNGGGGSYYSESKTLYVNKWASNGWEFYTSRPISTTEFSGVTIDYESANQVILVITYEGGSVQETEWLTTDEATIMTIPFQHEGIVREVKFKSYNNDEEDNSGGNIVFNSVKLKGISGALEAYPTSNLALPMNKMKDPGWGVNKVEQTITISKDSWSGWLLNLPISTKYYKGIRFTLTQAPASKGSIKIDYDEGDDVWIATDGYAAGGTISYDFTGDRNITQIIFNGPDWQAESTETRIYGISTCYIEPKPITATVTDAKYATFAVGAAIDYSATSGLTAYIAYVEDNKVKLTEVNKVPANTAVILYADVNESTPYTLTPTADTPDDVSANKLHVSDGTVEGDGSTIYVLASGDNGVGFYLVEEGSAITAGKAYLKVENGVAQARQFIGFGDDNETTGITMVQGEGFMVNGSDNYYDLQGRRVAQPTKGLYIVNGKKVIIK